MSKLVIALLAIFATTSAAAELAEDLRRCGGLDDNVERLSCFDKLAGIEKAKADLKASLSVGASPTPLDAGKWVVQSEASKIDDSTSVFVSVESKDPVAGRYGKTFRPRLTLRCMENTTASILEMDGAFMADSGRYGEVTFRIDRNPAFKRSMDESTDHKALGLWSGGAAIPFIKSLSGGQTLLVQATPFSESPVMFEFEIAGVDNAVAPLRKACRW